MKLQFLPSTLLLLLSPAAVSFAPRPTFHQIANPATQSTTLYQFASSTSYGIDDRSGNEKPVEIDPEEDMLAYVEQPTPVADRPNLDGKVLVSGWANTEGRSDQNVLDFLNDEESPFKFEEIMVFVNDQKAAKKKLLSRSARYSGLLDKMSFAQSETEGGLPTIEQLAGVKSWVANVGNDIEKVRDIAYLCSKSDVEYVSILMEDAGSILPDVVKSALIALDANSEKCKYTVVAVGEIAETAEGTVPYGIRDLGTEGGIVTGTYSRGESARLVTNALALDAGVNKAFSFVEVDTNCTEAKLVKALRETGYTRYQEYDHMITKGVAGYEKAVEEYKKNKYERENPDPELQARLQKERDELDKKNWEQSEIDFEKRKTDEIEENARSWAKREYFRKSMGGNMGMTEDEYVESVWERAMFEGDLKYRMLHGGKTDERTELAEFNKKQDTKKEAALKRARKALEEQLGTKLPDDDDKKDKDE